MGALPSCAVPDLRALSDERLLRLVRAGSRPAFDVFYDRHARTAYSVARDVVRDQDLAHDVVQMAFLGVWQSAAGYDPERCPPRSWLLAIVRNRGIDVLRRAKVNARRTAAAEPQEILRQRAPVTIDEGVAESEQNVFLRNAVATLPTSQRQAVELAFFAELTHSEISDQLSVPLGTVKSRIRLGVARLRDSVATAAPAGG